MPAEPDGATPVSSKKSFPRLRDKRGKLWIQEQLHTAGSAELRQR